MVRSGVFVWLLPLLLCVGIFALVATVKARSGERSRLPVVEPPSGFPLTVARDGVEPQPVPAPPERVLLANASAVDIVTELVPPDRIIGLPEQALTWSRLVDVDDGYRAKAMFRTIDPEAVIALRPDLLVCSTFNTTLSGDWTARAGIPVVSVPHPSGLDELRATITLLGRILDVEARALALNSSLDQRVQALGRGAPARRGLGALAYSNLGAGGFCAGARSLADDMIRMTGMQNVAAEVGKVDLVPFTFEDIITSDPDVIVVPGRFGEQDVSTYDLLMNEPTLANVKAITHGRIVRLHPRLFSTGSQEVVAAAEQLAAEVDRLLAAERGR